MRQDNIEYTQEQARELLGITPGNMRHWRKMVPYLSKKIGKIASFALSDLLGHAILRKTIKIYGVHISNISGGIDKLFLQLREREWISLLGCMAVIGAKEAYLYTANEVIGFDITMPLIVVLCKPIIANIQSHFIPSSINKEQPDIPLSLHLVGAIK